MSMDLNIYPVLQSRWKLEGKFLNYYGLRNYPNTFKRIIRLSKSQIKFINSLDGETSIKELLKSTSIPYNIKSLLNEDIIVDAKNRRNPSESLSKARFCTKCAANDFIIPGLEFDESGTCAICQSNQHLSGKISSPMTTFNSKKLKKLSNSQAKASRFDVALMFTGGKDSSYLLYYLSRVCNLRVLACTWTIPYMYPNARANIESAKKSFKNVEFIERNILPNHLNIMYKKSLELQGNTCLCPSLAYIIFYPIIAEENIPYILSGVEEAQNKNMLYNGFIPLNIYKLSNSKTLHGLINIGRIITLRPPFKNGQLQTITYLKQITYGNKTLKKVLGYNNEMVQNLYDTFNVVPEILNPLKKTIRISGRNGRIPTLANIDFNSISPEGVYDWNSIKEILQREMNWKGTGENEKDKGLHTSCVVEDGKDYSQFIRFKNMESMLIPFSAIELSNAVFSGNISRQRALEEISKMPGFSTTPPLGHDLMVSCDGLYCKELCGVYKR